ncbi:MAG: epimerase [Paracoccaceae bacterium]|nr:epimerase [Paracoccaceae bacterium]
MAESVLILGASGHFGHPAAEAFAAAGWEVRRFRRGSDDLVQAAAGAALIVNGWNPGYPRWADEVPGQTQAIVAAARATGAAILQPLNVYVYGPGAPEVLGADTPHAAQNPLARVRIEMEAALRGAGVPVILLRAGEFIGEAGHGGGWLDQVILKPIGKGRISYPGPLDVPHAWACLPDLARAAVALAEMRQELPEVIEIPFPGYTVTGHELAAGLAEALDRPVEARRMSWLPLRLAAPVWPLARGLLEMRYLWEMPHRLERESFDRFLPGFRETPLAEALHAAVSA